MTKAKKSKKGIQLVGSQKKSKNNLDTISFDYELSADYKVYAANGIFGGVTPKGELMINFFYERHSVPDHVTYNIKQDGTLGDEDKTKRMVSDSFVRSIPFGVSISIDTAKSFKQWLEDKITQHNNIFTQNQKEE